MKTNLHLTQTHALKQKTINYLDTAAKESERLFAMAIDYKAKYDAAKTSAGKEIYGKRLKKIVSKLDRHMSLFSALEQINTAHEKQDVEASEPGEQ